MRKPTKKLARCAAIATFIALFSAPPLVLPAQAQSTDEVEASASSSLRGILRRIFRDDEEQDPPTISRGGGVCLIAPVRPGTETAIWHSQPILVWEGLPGKIDVFNLTTDTVLWTYTPTEGQTHVRYGGEPLQSTHRYQWRVYEPRDLVYPQSFPSFEILPPISRLLLTNELTIAQTKTDGSEEAIAIAHADYFAERGMAADAIQSLFSVDQPTPALEDARAEIIETVCAAPPS